MSEIKVYQLNDCDWWAGMDLESVKSAFLREMELDESEIENPHEVSDEDMDRLKFVDGDDPAPPDFTFRKALHRMIDQGETFPCFFATTEY